MSVPSSGRARFGEKMTAHIELWLWRKCSGASPGARARSASRFKPSRPWARSRRAWRSLGLSTMSRDIGVEPDQSGSPRVASACGNAVGPGGMRTVPGASCPWLLPFTALMRASEAAWLEYAKAWSLDEPESNLPAEPAWTTRNSIQLDLPSMRMREFSRAPTSNPATLIIAPFALHGATIADFAPGHSIVETLQHAGVSPLLLVECKSATPSMPFSRSTPIWPT